MAQHTCLRTGVASQLYCHSKWPTAAAHPQLLPCPARLRLVLPKPQQLLNQPSKPAVCSRLHAVQQQQQEQQGSVDTQLGSAAWQDFTAAVSGEWEGVTATFDAAGQPQELPYHLVPGAYREWGMQLFDWQSICSMRADDAGLRYSVKRMMPTVGCEADAVAFTGEEHSSLRSAEHPGEPKTLLPDGCYSAGPRQLDAAAQGAAARLEHCLYRQPQERVRVVQHLQTAPEAAGSWALGSLEVHHERYEAPYNGGVSLSGCGGGMVPFAGKERVAPAAAAAGGWRVQDSACFGLGSAGEFVCSPGSSGSASAPDGEDGLLCLPLGIWSRVQQAQDGSLHAEVGCLVAPGRRRRSIRRYLRGRLTEAYLGTELS